MRCETVVERLDAFRTSELERRDRQAMARHLADCRECTDELEAVVALAGRCASLHVRAPESLKTEVLTRVGDRFGLVDTEVGETWVSFNERGITRIELATADAATFARACERRTGRRVLLGDVPERYVRAVQEAAAGAGPAEVPVDLSHVSAFARDVLELLPTIPRGEVRPYAWLARETGRPQAVRAVGNALAKNPVPLLLPCHRVVPSEGGVGNYALGSTLKRTLLEREGVPLADLDRLASAGIRYLGERGSGVFCLPTCGDLLSLPAEDKVGFSSPAQAFHAGYRPCTSCRPVAVAA